MNLKSFQASYLLFLLVSGFIKTIIQIYFIIVINKTI